MHTVLRHSRRLSTRVVKKRSHAFHTGRRFRTPDNRPEERDASRAQELNNKRQEQQDDREIEAHDNTDARRSGLRRTLRQRRLVEPPKPPPIPQWFLDRNVILQERASKDVVNGTRQIECIAAKTGEILFFTPWTEELGALVKQDTQHAQQTEGSKSESTPASASSTGGESSGSAHPRKTLQDVSTESIFGSIERPSELAAASAARIETELLVRATFSLAGQHVSTFAASKTGVSLEYADEVDHSAVNNGVLDLAASLDADIITLDANDIADLTGEYVGQGNDLPGTFHTLAHDVFEGRHSHKLAPRDIQMHKLSFDRPSDPDDEQEENEEDEDDIDAETRDEANSTHRFKSIGDFLKSRLQDMGQGNGPRSAAFSFAMPAGIVVGRARSSASRNKDSSSSDYVQWDDARLSAVLDQILDAALTKRSQQSGTAGTVEASLYGKDAPSGEGIATPQVEQTLSDLLATNISRHGALQNVQLRSSARAASAASLQTQTRTIVHIKDLHDICGSKLGDVVIRRLSKVVQKRRRLGQQIVIIGTSMGARNVTSEPEDSPWIDIVVPPTEPMALLPRGISDSSRTVKQVVADRGSQRILEVNTRNIVSMLRRIQSPSADHLPLYLEQDQLLIPGVSLLTEQILPLALVHRIVLGAMGIARTYMKSETIQPIHISLATAVLSVNEETKVRSQPLSAIPIRFGEHVASAEAEQNGTTDRTGRDRLDQIRKKCNSHETRLLSGVVDAQNIKTGFKDVHVAPETIEALKTLTTLSLLRPDAFKYGVLATDSLSGLMLYGPPGTGKTLLAKAVAKESKATVLEISGAQVYEKYVGEGEKMVRAVFTLAKKLSPCVVFIDEADALFGTRSSAGNRSTHREIINQFLREWDGMDDHRVFMMVASNRPFDMDDAVLRRLPRRLLVDLPLAADREKILGIHLRDEALDSAVSLSKLAEQTPLYSGSDLKNLCVAAAMAAVREENELAAQHEDESDFKLPEKRTLQLKHFDKALQEISASISEDMSSLTAIRKFDEQYGDRKGRRKKASYGFGALGGPVDESAARVRQGP